MSKARNIADLLSTDNGKIAGENLDVSFENITDTGTEGTRVASGTTAQRGSTAGQLRFNSDTGLAEYYTGTAFKAIDAPPVVSSIDVTEVDSQAGGNSTFVITGSGFNSGATVTFVGASGTDFNASTVTVDSATQITAVAPKASFLNAQEPYGVKVENTSGLSATLASQINVDTAPSWSTASGTLATITDSDTGTHATVSATDPDGDTVTYSETTSVLSGAGLSLNSSTGEISGDPTNVSGDTTKTFTLRATANTKTADRIFNIIIVKPKLIVGGTETIFDTSGDSYSLSSYGYNTVTVNGDMAVYIDMWGAGGGTSNGDTSNPDPTRGGAGGHTYGQITLLAGTTYVVLVGQGGRNTTTARSFPDGGNMNNDNSNRSSGGGSTRFGLYTQSGFNLTNTSNDYNNTNAVYELIAGGGGGGSAYATDSGTPAGYGGGTNGASGGAHFGSGGDEPLSSVGGGGSQSAGGAGGTGGRLANGTAGAKYLGGTGTGTGGGGGYYGGGGSSGYYSMAGGGSGFINSTSGLLSNTGFQTASAGGSSYYTAPNGTRSNKPSNSGNGQYWLTNNGNAYDGAIVFTKV